MISLCHPYSVSDVNREIYDTLFMDAGNQICNKCQRFFTTMMTSSNGNIFRVTGRLCGEFTGPGEFTTQRAVTRNFGVFFDLRLNKRLSKQPWGSWFETLSWSLWRHCNADSECTLFSFTLQCHVMSLIFLNAHFINLYVTESSAKHALADESSWLNMFHNQNINKKDRHK